jgi:hypothetical protein
MEHHSSSGDSSLLGFILTLIQVVAGISVGTWDIPDNVIHVLQCGAFCGAIASGLVTVLNYFGIKWKPFKKKK